MRIFANLLAMDTTATNAAGASQSISRYSMGAISFHWLIAALIALNYAAAWYAEDLPKAEHMQVMGNHKAFGIVILVLTVLRIVWRLMHTPPPLLESLKSWEAALAKVTHGLLYVLMLAIPLAGWAMHSAFSGGAPVSLFGLFDFPGLPMAQDKATGGTFHDMHGLLATLMLGLVGLHVLAAFKHQLVDKDGTLRRMLPWR